MPNGVGYDAGDWSVKLQAIATAVQDAASGAGDTLMLLALLRQLEQLHRDIRDGIFQSSLPDNRQALYSLLKDIEAQGGWPYIERMKLEEMFANLPTETESDQRNGMGAFTYYTPNHSTTVD